MHTENTCPEIVVLWLRLGCLLVHHYSYIIIGALDPTIVWKKLADQIK